MSQSRFGNPRVPSNHVRPFRPMRARGREAFFDLPDPVGKPPFRLSLESVLGKADVAKIAKAGRLVFHAIGDSGGIKDPIPQLIVAKKLVEQLGAEASKRPAFCYHLGDVVYFRGDVEEYYAQFYHPYEEYTVPIFAIPGNHDGMNPRLAAFMRNFCWSDPEGRKNLPDEHNEEAGDVGRFPLQQPNCYFTLEAPFATIVGLYSNVPEGGEIKDDQKEWLIKELREAPTNKALILAVHHPIFSLDDHHSGSETMRKVVFEAFEEAERAADLVLTAHVHNYQRFTKTWRGRSIPFIVAGASGYHNLHDVKKPADGSELRVPMQVPGEQDLQFDDYLDDRHGFLKLEVGKDELQLEYFSVPRPYESWKRPAVYNDNYYSPLTTIKTPQRR